MNEVYVKAFNKGVQPASVFSSVDSPTTRLRICPGQDLRRREAATDGD